jgi:molybdate transport system permease protein
MWATAVRHPHGGRGDEETGANLTDVPRTPTQIAADLTPAAVAELGAVPGERLWFVVKAAEVTVLLR